MRATLDSARGRGDLRGDRTPPSMPRPFLVAVLLASAAAAPIAAAQSVQYRAPSGTEFRAPADTGPVARAAAAAEAVLRRLGRR